MLDFADVVSQMQALFNNPISEWRTPGEAMEMAAQIGVQADKEKSFNATIRTAIENGAVPETWHPALLLDEDTEMCASYPAPPALAAYQTVATDGSQVYPDPHHIADFYLLNVSRIMLRYGVPGHPENALLSARPFFAYGAPNDAWHNALNGGFANRELIDARRHVSELNELASLLETAERTIPVIGLCDGIFDLRVSAAQSWRDFAHEENERALDRLRAAGRPIGGYIAASRASDVMTALQIILLQNNGGEADESLSGLTDTRLFDHLLSTGHRSATFMSKRGKPDREQKPSRHETCFFYIKTDEGEVTRLEFPIWVAQRKDWLDTLHAVILSQTEKGDGYPIALMEAHEHAVVRASDREAFYALVEDVMLAQGLQPRRSAKGRSKSRPLV